ncbi:MAG: membrane protein insertase YidC, partial [Ignavibacteria bacterium]|nr:membrane protein insertase YidC [Ignavibacteria bacterium]
MDRRSIIGFVLIGVVLMFWLYWNTSKTPPPQPKKQDTVKVETKQSTDTNKAPITSIPTTKDSITNSLGSIFSKSSATGTTTDSLNTKPLAEKIIQVENKKVFIEFSNYGGTVKKFTLKDFQTWDKNPLQLVNWKKSKELHLIFTSKDGKQISTANLVFNADYKEWDKINIEENKDFKLKYTLNVSADSSQKIVKTNTFKPDSYEFDVTYELFN